MANTFSTRIRVKSPVVLVNKLNIKSSCDGIFCNTRKSSSRPVPSLELLFIRNERVNMSSCVFLPQENILPAKKSEGFRRLLMLLLFVGNFVTLIYLHGDDPSDMFHRLIWGSVPCLICLHLKNNIYFANLLNGSSLCYNVPSDFWAAPTSTRSG